MADDIITSTANPKIKRIRSLAVKKFRDEEGVFVIEGLRYIEAALANNWQIETLVFCEEAKNDPDARKAIEACREKKAQMLDVSGALLGNITNRDNPQPVIAVCKQKRQDIGTVIISKPVLWLGLENIRDPGNLGTIIRTADAVGVAGIILIGNTCDPYSPEVMRATAGSFAGVRVIKSSLADFLQWKSDFKGSVIGTHLRKDAVDYRAANITLPALLLMGGEQSGLSPELSAACDSFIKIPMRAGVESLNLAVSTGILLYQLSPPSSPT